MAEIYCDIVVAHATPSTLILKNITNIALSIRFISPDNERITNGRFVSPFDLNIALPKL